jgi:hypothetical protein
MEILYTLLIVVKNVDPKLILFSLVYVLRSEDINFYDSSLFFDDDNLKHWFW